MYKYQKVFVLIKAGKQILFDSGISVCYTDEDSNVIALAKEWAKKQAKAYGCPEAFVSAKK